MYHNEHQIAQAEFAIFQAKFNRQPAEGVTVKVPNIFDRTVALLKDALAIRKMQPQPRKAHRAMGAPAK
jgi:hypothetical protein